MAQADNEFYREDSGRRSCGADLEAAQNPMQVPRITKITVNMGVGEAVADRKVIDAAVGDLTKITGQKPLISAPARRSPPSSCARACRSAAR